MSKGSTVTLPNKINDEENTKKIKAILSQNESSKREKKNQSNIISKFD